MIQNDEESETSDEEEDYSDDEKDLDAPAADLFTIVGALMSFASGLFMVYMIVNLFDRAWWYLLLGSLVLLGSGLLMKGASSAINWAITSAVCLIAVDFVAFMIPYLCKGMVVGPIWWVMMFILALLASTLLLAWSCYNCCKHGVTCWTKTGFWCIAFVCIIVTLLLAFLGFGSTVQGYSSTLLSLDHVHWKKGIGLMGSPPEPCPPDDKTCCRVTEPGCKLSDFIPGQLYNVYPGGDTVCQDRSEYFFQVVRGNPRKLLFYFQGGGACWNFLVYWQNQCTRWVDKGYYDGILNFTRDENNENPYRDYTIIKVNYCSGDMFAGNADQFWIIPGATEYPWKFQRGYNQARAVLDWTTKQFTSGGLHDLSSFMVSGSSAGSLGVQWWAATILQELQAVYNPKGTSIVGDSFIGALVGGNYDAEANLYRTWNMCNTGILSEAQIGRCNAGTLRLDEVYASAMVSFPEIAFANIQSKYDHTQIEFANFVEIFDGLSQLVFKPTLFTPESFYAETNHIFRRFKTHQNYQAYLVNTDQHTYLETDYVFLADPSGPKGNCNVPTVGLKMIDWLVHAPMQNQWQCYDMNNTNESSIFYCDKDLPYVQRTCSVSLGN